MKPKRTIIFYINASLRVPYIGNKCTAHETHGRKLMQSNGVPSQSQHHHQQEGDNVYLPASRYMEKRCCSASKGDNYILHQCELCVPYSGNKCTAHETHGRKWMRSNGVPSQSQHHHQQEKESDNVNCITCMYLPEIQRLDGKKCCSASKLSKGKAVWMLGRVE